MFIVHCNRPSKSARALAKALRGRKVNLLHGWNHAGDVVINWGDGNCIVKEVLNSPQAVRLAANKRDLFLALSKAGVKELPKFATSRTDVNWKGVSVVRHKLTGHSGEGIEIVDDTADLPPAPLYVQYIKKEQEFRIHVGRVAGETRIIAVQRKARDLSVPDGSVNWQVRNHCNGFIFAREGANPTDSTLQAACNALRASGLDFGAVDVIFNAKEGRPYVLEINTAPGLEGQTISDYKDFFSAFVADRTPRIVPRQGIGV